VKIHDLAARGDVEGVRAELRRGVPVDLRDEADYTPLARAAESPAADLEMLQLLVDAGAQIDLFVGKEDRDSILKLAACSESLPKVELLLQRGANVNLANSHGYTPLINVMYCLHDSDALLPMIELLIHNGAAIDVESSYGESPLAVASRMRFDAVRALLAHGANPVIVGWNELMQAVAAGSVEEVARLAADKVQLHERDLYDRTPWILAVTSGDIDKARVLLAAGADREDRNRGGETALAIAASEGHTPLLQWLISEGLDLEAANGMRYSPLMLAAQRGHTDCVRLLLQAGANPRHTNEFDDSAISIAANEELVELLVAAGESIGDIRTELKRRLTGLRDGSELAISSKQYFSDRTRRFGKSNPSAMDIPFWRDMVRSGINAYMARKQFGDTERFDEPVWCFDRFGMTFTALPDGRFVQIGGEHEDYYDPDFCIYNDVILHDGPGEFRMFGYPREAFPPTDFHTATYHMGGIYIIGGLGYQGERQFGTTPVYRLDCSTWRIHPVLAHGDNPGWIYKHHALLVADVITITGGDICRASNGREGHTSNAETFELDLATLCWRRSRASGTSSHSPASNPHPQSLSHDTWERGAAEL
jgi:ankyrin repeat protein